MGKIEASGVATKHHGVVKINKKSKSKDKAMIQKQVSLQLMMLPGIVMCLIFNIAPMFGLLIAFENFNPLLGVFGSSWVGLENFERLFTMPSFVTALINSLTISLFKLFLTTVFAFLFALFMHELTSKFIKKSVQTLVYLPHFLSWVILSVIFSDLLAYDGEVNNILSVLGIGPIEFLTSNSVFKTTIVGTHIWKEFGYGSILYLAALTGIDPSSYEAARVEGANKFKQVFIVTIPGVVHILIIQLVLGMGYILNAGFDQVYNMYNPLVYDSGEIIETLTYKQAMVESNFGISTATGLFKSAIGFVLILSTRFVSKKIGYNVL